MSESSKSQFLTLTELHGELPLFFQPWWLDEACSNGWDVAIAAARGEIKAIFPYSMERKYGLNLIRNPLLTPYLGPYIIEPVNTILNRWEAQEKYVGQLWEQFRQWDFFQFQTVPEFENFQLFHKLGFSNNARLTYYINLKQSEEELFSRIHPRRRNYIRKAEKSVIVEEEKQPNLHLFYQWHKHAFTQKKARYPYTVSFIKRLVDVAYAHESSLFLTAKDGNGKPLAMLWTPFDQKKAYHLLGAYDPSQNVNGVMDLLVWSAVKAVKSKGKSIYDFEGSMDPGIESFFRKFGGERKQYFNFEQNRSLVLKLKSALWT